MIADHVVGIDQGTSSTKALLLNRGGEVVAEAKRPMQSAFPRPGWVEQDPEAMFDNQIACVRELLERSEIAADRVAALGVDNHTETLVLWDRQTGKAVHPAIIWQCRRSTAEVAALDSVASRRLIRARTGLDLDPTFTATKLLWIFRNCPDIADGLRDGRVLFGTVDCWLIWKLTGGACYATEASNAARTMLFRIDNLAWDPELIALFQLELAVLPEVRNSTGPFGATLPAYFGTEIPITGALGDQQASLFGHGCFAPGELKATYGTGAFIWLNDGVDFHSREAAGYLQTIAWNIDRPVYALEGFVMCAGAILDWLAETLRLGANAAEVMHEAEDAGGSRGVALVPALQGLGSPWWDPEVKAAILGMSSATEVGQICHAGLEAVLFQVRRVLEDMKSDDESACNGLRVDGGLARSGYAMQLQADILGIPVHRAEIEHLTPYGVGLLAGLGAGLWSDLEALAALDRPTMAFQPQADAFESWTRRYQDWCRAVDATLAWTRELARS